MKSSIGSLAALAALTAPVAANAMIVVSTFTPFDASSDVTSVDIDGNGTTDVVFNSDVSEIGGSGSNRISVDGSSANMLSEGELINAGLNFDDFADYTAVSGYIGVEFERDGNTHYGWLAQDYNGGDDSRYIFSGAWENTMEEGIDAGAVPEPGATAAMAGGAAGLAALLYRRSRKKKA